MEDIYIYSNVNAGKIRGLLSYLGFPLKYLEFLCAQVEETWVIPSLLDLMAWGNVVTQASSVGRGCLTGSGVHNPVEAQGGALSFRANLLTATASLRAE